jgi:hypothetical protein
MQKGLLFSVQGIKPRSSQMLGKHFAFEPISSPAERKYIYIYVYLKKYTFFSWTIQGLMLARQVLYHLSHSPQKYFGGEKSV